MLTLIKNIIISTVISFTIFIGLEYLRNQALQFPINKVNFSEPESNKDTYTHTNTSTLKQINS